MSPSEKYLAHLDQIFQTEPKFLTEKSLLPNVPGVTGIVYENIPEPGMLTVVTYGLSLIKHPSWKLGRPELIMSINTTDPTWETVPAYLANQLRGKFAFTYGETINFNVPIAKDSAMDGFLIFAPAILEQQDFLNIDVGLDYKINLAGLYPIYAREAELVDTMGLEAFWHHPKFDMYDILREEIKK